MIFNASKYNKKWQDKKLSELGSFQRGKSKHRPRNDAKLFKNGEFPLIQTGEVKSANLYIRSHSASYNEFGLAQSKLWPKDTLCITIAANIAETALLGYEMCFPDSIVGFNANPDESSELFMHYVFTYIRKAIQNSASGSIQDNINIDYLTGLNFKIPKKEYQDKIVNILSSLDRKIELNNEINTELEAMAKTLYNYWFVQFDFPDVNGRPYKSSGGKMVYNEVLKREIPEDWTPYSVADLVDIKTGKEDANFASDQGEYHFFTCGINNLRCDVYAFDGKAILIAGNGSFSVKKYEGKFNAYQRTYVLMPEDSFFEILYFAIEDRVSSFTAGSRGSIVKFITKGDIENIYIPLPKEYDLEFNNILNTLLTRSSNLYNENLELEKLRDWLLPMLMNGQVTVKS